LNALDGRLKRTWVVSDAAGLRRPDAGSLRVEGVLTPTRAIHFTQRIDSAPVGGVTYALHLKDKRDIG
jgi:hypothetical protein